MVVGIGLSVYYESHTVFGVEIFRSYPYRDVGMLLILGGILCSIIGVVYSPKQETNIQTESILENKLKMKCPNCNQWNSIDVKKVKDTGSLYMPFKTENCSKCGQVIAKENELIRITPHS